MIRLLIKFLDGITIRMKLGDVLKRKAEEVRQLRPGLSNQETELIAKQEIFQSLRANNVNVQSRESIQRWANIFLP